MSNLTKVSFGSATFYQPTWKLSLKQRPIERQIVRHFPFSPVLVGFSGSSLSNRNALASNKCAPPVKFQLTLTSSPAPALLDVSR